MIAAIPLLVRDPELVTFAMCIITAVSVLLMVDLYLHRSCDECMHCKEKKRKADEASAEQRHTDYHFFDKSKCQGLTKCPGYRRKK